MTNQRMVVIALLPAWMALGWFVSKAGWVWIQKPELRFGWLIAALMVYMWWETVSQTQKMHCRWTPVAMMLAVAAVGLLFVSQIYEAAFGMNSASLFGFTLGVVCWITANAAYVFGSRIAASIGAVSALLFFALPMPSIIQASIVGGLQQGLAAVTSEVLNVFGVPVERTGSVLRLSGGIVGVDEACSGIRSLQAVMMVSVITGHWLLPTRSARGVLVAIAIVLAIVGNMVRSVFLCVVVHVGSAAAIDRCHDAAGWLALIFTGGGLVMASAILAWRQNRVPGEPVNQWIGTRSTKDGGNRFDPCS